MTKFCASATLVHPVVLKPLYHVKVVATERKLINNKQLLTPVYFQQEVLKAQTPLAISTSKHRLVLATIFVTSFSGIV
jgi:hypothetical protein